jgi:Xaa-Pro dipeptidase
MPGADSSHVVLGRPVALVVAGAPAPHLYTPYPEGAPAELSSEFVHPALYPELEEGMPDVAGALEDMFAPDARLGCDELTHVLSGCFGSREIIGASVVLDAARLCKTPDELASIRAAQRINELAMWDVQCALVPGLRQTDLSAIFLRRIFDLGATANAIDPIWQVMGPTRAEGSWTIHGDLAFPTPTTDRILREGDVIWVDAGICHQGYASDFGRTWLTGDHPSPTERQASHFERWRAVVDAARDILKPGVSALELGQAAIAANNGVKPWLEHFYLAHGVGTDSAEMPLVGTDLGEDFDASLIMSPGMVLVFEPVIWDDGFAGYRSEDIVAVTDTGWVQLSGYRYDPFEVAV